MKKVKTTGYRTDVHRVIGETSFEDIMDLSDRNTYLNAIREREKHWEYYKAAKSRNDSESCKIELLLYREESQKVIDLKIKIRDKIEAYSKEYIDVILEEDYKYKRDYIRDRYLFSQSYISQDINKVVSALYITAPVKALFRDVLESQEYHRQRSTIAEGYTDKLIEVSKKINLKDMLFYREKDIAHYILARFKKTSRKYNDSSFKNYRDEAVNLSNLDMYLLLNARIYTFDTYRIKCGAVNTQTMYDFYVHPLMQEERLLRFTTYNSEKPLVRYIDLTESDVADMINDFKEKHNKDWNEDFNLE